MTESVQLSLNWLAIQEVIIIIELLLSIPSNRLITYILARAEAETFPFVKSKTN